MESINLVQQDEMELLERKLKELHDKQNELANESRRVISEIRMARADIEDERQRIKVRKLEEAKKKIEEEKLNAERAIVDTAKMLEAMKLSSWDKAHDFQKEDIVSVYHDFLQGDSTGFFNANDMGLGKTIETILTLQAMFKDKPKAKCLWLTKSQILKTGSTEREFKKWAPDMSTVSVMGNESKDQREFKIELINSMESVILLTNYETVRTTKALQDATFEFVVMDEVHKLKGGANTSGPTGIWKSVKDYCWDIDTKHGTYVPKVEYIQMLSGTPMVNRVAELWAYLHIFSPQRFPKLRQFEAAFGVYAEMGGKVDTGKILNMCLKDKMVRRTRDEVGIELPPIQIIEREVEYNDQQQEAYNQMRDQFFIWLEGQGDEPLTATAIIAQLTRLRQISCWPVFTQQIKDENGNVLEERHVNIPDSAKVDEAMDLIEEHGDQVVVCCNFNNVFDEIQKRAKDMGLTSMKITGDSKDKELAMAEVAFQNNEVDILLINTMMGEGLNLQKNPEYWSGGANMTIHLDRWWNPAREDQANARTHRQGATHNVLVYMIHNPNSVDEFVKSISDEKAEIFSGIMNSDKIRPKNEWKELLGKMI